MLQPVTWALCLSPGMTIGTHLVVSVCVCVCGEFVCKLSPPDTYSHMVQSWPIFGPEGEKHTREQWRVCSITVHQVMWYWKMYFDWVSFFFSAKDAAWNAGGKKTKKKGFDAIFPQWWHHQQETLKGPQTICKVRSTCWETVLEVFKPPPLPIKWVELAFTCKWPQLSNRSGCGMASSLGTYRKSSSDTRHTT